MDRHEVISNEIEELGKRIDFLQEVMQAEDSQEQGSNSDNNDSQNWPTITNQMS